jgi:hypothetical protein
MTYSNGTISVADLGIIHYLRIVKIRVRIFEIMTPCIPLDEYTCFGGAYFLRLQGEYLVHGVISKEITM